MDASTPTICNYCEGQAFDKGRCLGCGASSWKLAKVFDWILPKQQPAETSESTGGSTFVQLIQSIINLVEKLVSTVMTVIKYKLLFIFSCLVLAAFTGSFTTKSGTQKKNVTVSEYQSQRVSEPAAAVPIGTWSGERIKPIPIMQAPSPRVLIDNQEPSSFPIPKTTWGNHFNPTKLVPSEGFLAFYFDSSDPTQLVHPVQVNKIGIDYSWSDFRGIPSNNFGAYWVGVITTLETETLEVIADDGWNEFRVIIDGSIVQEHSRKSGPAAMIQPKIIERQRSHRAPGEEIVVLQETVQKVYPKSRAGNPLVTLTPGEHLVEIELLNNWHTTEFSAQFKRVR